MPSDAEAGDRQQTMPPILLQEVDSGIARYQQRKRNVAGRAGGEDCAPRDRRAAEPIVLFVILQSMPEFLQPVRIGDGTRKGSRETRCDRGARTQIG
jgi:hypothetical protein